MREEDAQHTGDGNDEHQEQGRHVGEEQHRIQKAEVQPKEKIAHLHGAADEDEREQHAHAQKEEVDDFLEYLSLEKRRHRAASCGVRR